MRICIFLFFTLFQLLCNIDVQSQGNLLPSSELNKQKKFNSVDEALKNKENAYILSLSNQSLKVLPTSLFQLTKIQYLDLRNNQLSSIPKEILQLKNLQYLILSENMIASIPAYITGLIELKTLDVTGNRISSLPLGFSGLKNLEELNIENNRFQVMPNEICKIVNLKILKIWDNPFTEIPHSICKIEKLEELFINSDQLLGIISQESTGDDPKTNSKQCIIDENEQVSDNTNKVTKGVITNLKKLHIRKKTMTTEQQKTIENAFKTTKIIYY